MTLQKQSRNGAQHSNVVPYDFEFNAQAIKGYMDPHLPDGVLVENIMTLLQLRFIKVADPKEGDKPSDGVKYIITPPEPFKDLAFG